MKNLYIIHYSHRHGNDIWPEWHEVCPTGKFRLRGPWRLSRPPRVPARVRDEIAADLDDFEPDREETIEILGPFEGKAD